MVLRCGDGARYYDPVSTRFLSPDPAGHEGSWDLYSFADGDPVNQFDPDGRFAAGAANGAAQWADRTYAGWGNALDAVLKPFFQVGTGLGFKNQLFITDYLSGGYEENPIYQRNFEQGSEAYKWGHEAGYVGAELGFQLAVMAATEGMGTLARGAVMRSSGGLGWGMGGAVARMGGTMPLVGSEMAGASAARISLAGAAGTMTGSSGAGQGVTINVNARSPAVASESAFAGRGAMPPANARLSPMNYEWQGSLSTPSIPNRGNGGRGGGPQHATIQQHIFDSAGGGTEKRVYLGGTGNYRIVDNLDASGRYHQIGDMRWRSGWRPSSRERGAIEDLRKALGSKATIIYHDKQGIGPSLINPDLQPGWKPAPRKYRKW